MKTYKLICNNCKQTKVVSESTYQKMLTRFRTNIGIITGITQGFSFIYKKEAPWHKLTNDKLEILFLQTYICKTCKSNPNLKLHYSKLLLSILNSQT